MKNHFCSIIVSFYKDCLVYMLLFFYVISANAQDNPHTAKENLFPNGYFTRLVKSDERYILKQVTPGQKIIFQIINKISSPIICKAFLSNSSYIFVEEREYNGVHMLIYGIPDVPRIAYVEAIVNIPKTNHTRRLQTKDTKAISEPQTWITYKGYQRRENDLHRVYPLWSCGWDVNHYELYDPSLPKILYIRNKNEILEKLCTYWNKKGYRYVASKTENGEIIYTFKKVLHWGYCIRIMYKNNTIIGTNVGYMADSLPTS